jgi:hypothetical protein
MPMIPELSLLDGIVEGEDVGTEAGVGALHRDDLVDHGVDRVPQGDEARVHVGHVLDVVAGPQP